MNRITSFIRRLSVEHWIVIGSALLAVAATIYSYLNGHIIAYGDAESHLNISKRVIHSLTPGLAQLGGIWLPLPHIMLVPFVASDFLWRTGLAGSIVSGVAFVISTLYIYKFVLLLTRHKLAAVFAAALFAANPNILYMQSTPMTELVLIAFFALSGYYFVAYLFDPKRISNIVFAAFFGFCASLSRYDGWGLVLMEAAVLALYHVPWKRLREGWSRLEGRLVLFSTMAFFGIFLWLTWGFLILGDPLYFTHSEFSAKSQQNSWQARGELPSYRDIGSALTYYSTTSTVTTGSIVTVIALAGFVLFAIDGRMRHRPLILLILAVPFIFNVATLFLGQSVIFIPNLTPDTFEWNLFNVRYGLMMMPCAAIAGGYLFYRLSLFGYRRAFQVGLAVLAFAQVGIFALGKAPVITLEDGTYGLSSLIAKNQDAERWFINNYDHGKLLADDFSRAISIVHSPIEMKDVIYIGNKPYWEESLKEPEKYARWIIIQEHDPIWKNVWEDADTRARLFAYFQRVYTSSEVMIFRRTEDANENTLGKI